MSRKKLEPIHPAEILLEKFLKPMGIGRDLIGFCAHMLHIPSFLRLVDPYDSAYKAFLPFFAPTLIRIASGYPQPSSSFPFITI